jgi:hypothetical protein
MNFAVPGFRFGQKYALASEAIPQYRPAVALYQDWDMEWGGAGCAYVPPGQEFPVDYAKLGDDIYGVMGMHLRSDGYPGLRGIPDGLNAWFFLHSYLYQYVTMALGEQELGTPGCGADSDLTLRLRSLRKFIALARSVGTKPAIYLAADLSYPMKEPHRAPPGHDMKEILVLGQTDHLPVFPLRPLLADQDNTAIRLDDWHFNAAGHRVLAERFESVVLNILDGQLRSGTSPTAPGSTP